MGYQWHPGKWRGKNPLMGKETIKGYDSFDKEQSLSARSKTDKMILSY